MFKFIKAIFSIVLIATLSACSSDTNSTTTPLGDAKVIVGNYAGQCDNIGMGVAGYATLDITTIGTGKVTIYLLEVPNIGSIDITATVGTLKPYGIVDITIDTQTVTSRRGVYTITPTKNVSLSYCNVEKKEITLRFTMTGVGDVTYIGKKQ